MTLVMAREKTEFCITALRVYRSILQKMLTVTWAGHPADISHMLAIMGSTLASSRHHEWDELPCNGPHYLYEFLPIMIHRTMGIPYLWWNEVGMGAPNIPRFAHMQPDTENLTEFENYGAPHQSSLQRSALHSTYTVLLLRHSTGRRQLPNLSPKCIWSRLWELCYWMFIKETNFERKTRYTYM